MNSSHPMKQLQEDYLKSLPEKIVQLQHAKMNKDWEVLQNDFHKLKGSGKTYGFPQITDIAQIVEQILELEKNPDKLSVISQKGIELLDKIAKNDVGFDLVSDVEFQELLKFYEELSSNK